MNQSNSDVQKLRELIKGIRVAMLTTVDSEGCLHSRPMATQDAEFDGTLWFFTEADSLKIHELERDRHVYRVMPIRMTVEYVSVVGTAGPSYEITKRSKSSGHRFMKLGFQKGVDDPNIALLRVAVDKAEYWDSPSSAVVRLIGFAKAVVTGKRYGDEGTDHQNIKL